MSIGELSLTARHADHLHKKAVNEPSSHTAGEAAKKSEAPPEAKDRVEISEAGQRALGGAFTSADVEFARKALAGAPPLSAERLSEIQTRLQSGFYTGDEARQAIAAGLAATFLGGDV